MNNMPKITLGSPMQFGFQSPLDPKWMNPLPWHQTFAREQREERNRERKDIKAEASLLVPHIICFFSPFCSLVRYDLMTLHCMWNQRALEGLLGHGARDGWFGFPLEGKYLSMG